MSFQAADWVLVVVSTLAGGGLVLLHRLLTHASAGDVVGHTIEGCLYAGLSAAAGALAGQLFGRITHPAVMGGLFAILAVLAVVLAIIATVRGDGPAAWKVGGWIAFLLLAVALALVMGTCFAAAGDDPKARDGYVQTMGLALGAFGAASGVLVALFRGATVWLGWLLTPLNASWGALGNILGLMTHISSWCFYAGHGRIHTPSARKFYVCYEHGMSLKEDAGGRFAFTEGAVMSADDDELRKHEGVHVLQHYIFGPIYPLTHVAWFAVMALVGLIASPIRGVDVGTGITALSYYSNPWEVMAYAFGGFRHESDPLVIPDVPGWIVGLLWIGAGTVGFIVYLASGLAKLSL